MTDLEGGLAPVRLVCQSKQRGQALLPYLLFFGCPEVKERDFDPSLSPILGKLILQADTSIALSIDSSSSIWNYCST